jgi:hypothetical protein
MARFSVVTADFIAACAQFNFSFWADAPIPNVVWAVSDDQKFHLVKVNRKDHMVEHVCGRSLEKGDVFRPNCPGAFVAKPFPNLAAGAKVTGLTLLELVAASTFSAKDAVDLFTTALNKEDD